MIKGLVSEGFEDMGDVAPMPKMCRAPEIVGGEPCKIAQGIGCDARRCALLVTDLAPEQEDRVVPPTEKFVSGSFHEGNYNCFQC